LSTGKTAREMHVDSSTESDPEQASPIGERLGSMDPEALYLEGMAFYRRRRWREARECFTKLHALDPNRRGIEALLRELDMFQQLEAVRSEGPSDTSEVVLDEATDEADASTASVSREGDKWWVKLIVALLILAVASGAVYYVLSGGPARSSNLCQAYTVARQNCKAIEACAALLESAPEDREAANNLEKAKARLYDEALAGIKANTAASLSKAWEELDCIFVSDPSYRDVRTLLEQIKTRQALDAIYEQALASLNRQECDQAENKLLQIRTMDPEYAPTQLGDALYTAYVCQGNQHLAVVVAAVQPVSPTLAGEAAWNVTVDALSRTRLAIRAFDRATREKPASEEAKLSRTLAESLQTGLERYSLRAWGVSIEHLGEIYRRDQSYLQGKVAALLCDAHLHQAEAFFQGGQLEAALTEYQTMLAIQGCASDTIRARAMQVGIMLTPTATPTLTPTPTSTPTPTATYTPRPTETPVPTRTPTPIPTATPRPTQSTGPGPDPGPGPGPEPIPTPLPR
jgi:tetratricopeptide (TPR) repeat protein